MNPPVSAAGISVIILIIITVKSPPVTSLGSSSCSTLAIISSSSVSSTVCGILAGSPTHIIQCYKNDKIISVLPNTSYESISGGRNFFCGLTSGGFSLLCWDTTNFRAKRIYSGHPLTELTVGEFQVCAIQLNTSLPLCWRFPSPEGSPELQSITSGKGFSCGLLKKSSRVICWGRNEIGIKIEAQFGNFTMLSLIAGESHVCGVTRTGSLICRGGNSNGQLNVPIHKPFKFSGLALGANYTCAIQRENGLVICWGVELLFQSNKNISFESIVGSSDFICGLTTKNLSIICWGLRPFNYSLINVPLPIIIPGPCVQSSCEECGLYPNSDTLCGGVGNICKPCQSNSELPFPVILPPKPPPSKPKGRQFLVFLLVGSIGGFAGICTILYLLWKVFVCKKLHEDSQISGNVARFDATSAAMNNGSLYSSRKLRRDKYHSGDSTKYSERPNIYTLGELIVATNDFSLRNKIGGGSFGSVYKGEISGREVAIKKGDSASKMKKFQEREMAFDSELVLLSRVHHKHLVELIGFCEEQNEMILVYEYMRNGSLHDHLHNKTNLEISDFLDSWKMRIKIALDAAKGIEYLHNYAVPPIIHRDIKSSNILLDENWTAKISDFGLSLMGPDPDQESLSIKAVGTVGYIDPEYYVLNNLTAKSDVYGFGVVLLEILTGKRAVFREGGGPMAVVEYARNQILVGELGSVLDRRVRPPEMGEVEAVEVMGFLALKCVSLEGKERPSVSEVVGKLERAYGLCEDRDGSVSSTSFSISSL